MTRQFTRLAEGIDVAPLLAELDAHPELWGEHTQRLTATGPHADSSDIWCRYRAAEELTSPRAFAEPHFAVWYPCVALLPSIRPLAMHMMRLVEATYLGGILLTRLPPGGRILPHHDAGGWHAESMRAKVWLPLRANEGCFNHCEDETVVMRPGEAYHFDNLKVHSVENTGSTERIVFICCMRTD